MGSWGVVGDRKMTKDNIELAVATALFFAIILLTLFGCISVKKHNLLLNQERASVLHECNRNQELMYNYYQKNYRRLSIEEIQEKNK